MRLASLCDGIGGLPLALAPLGFELVWLSEIDPDACRVTEQRWPGVPNLGDLETIDRPPAVDAVVAGFPCQPISQAGRQKGIDDERWLWPAIAGLLRRMDPRPGVVLLENVPRLLTINDGGALAEVLHDLDALGFDAEWGCLAASTVGACHRRERWWLAAHARGARTQGVTDVLPTQALAHSVRLSELPPTDGDARPGLLATPRTSDTNGPARHGEGGPDLRTQIADLIPTPTVSDAKGPSPNHGGTTAEAIGALLPTPTAMDGSGSRSLTSGRTDLKPTTHVGTTLSDVAYANLWDRYGPAVARHEHAFGRPVPTPVVDAPTTEAGVALSAEFVEWMMGYPQGWVTDLFDWRTPSGRRAALRLLGNSVVPACATAAYSGLLERLAAAEVAA